MLFSIESTYTELVLCSCIKASIKMSSTICFCIKPSNVVISDPIFCSTASKSHMYSTPRSLSILNLRDGLSMLSTRRRTPRGIWLLVRQAVGRQAYSEIRIWIFPISTRRRQSQSNRESRRPETATCFMQKRGSSWTLPDAM